MKTPSRSHFSGSKRPSSAPKSHKGGTVKTGPKQGKSAPQGHAKSASFKKPTTKSESFKKPSKPAPKQVFHAQSPKLQRNGILLWGLHATREAWVNEARKCHHLWATEAGLAAFMEGIEGDAEARPSPILVEKAELERLLPQGSVHQGVVLDVEPLPEVSLDDFLGSDDENSLIVILDQVTDPHNIGAILRSAAAFGASAVIVTERNAPSVTGIMAKTASGAMEHVDLITVVNIARTIETLKEENYWCIGLAEEGEHDLSDSKMSDGRLALVMGAEGAGLRRLTREHCDELARLPTQGPIGSLNVSNAACVALYEAMRQRKAKLPTV